MALCLHQLPAADIQSDLTPHGSALVAADVADMGRKTATLKAATQVVRVTGIPLLISFSGKMLWM